MAFRHVYNAFTRRRQPENFPYRSPTQVNANVQVAVSARGPYEPPKYSDTPVRPALARPYISFNPNEYQSDQRYQAIAVAPPPRAQYPRGLQNPHTERANIEVPPHIAYGSLFSTPSLAYGHY